MLVYKRIHLTRKKVNEIFKAPTPKNMSELRSFLISANYYHRYLNNISTGSIVQMITKRNSLEMGTNQSLCLWAIIGVANVNLRFGSL